MRLGKSLWVGPSQKPQWRQRWIIPLLWIGAMFIFMAMMTVVYVGAWLNSRITHTPDPEPRPYSKSNPELRTVSPARSTIREVPPATLAPPREDAREVRQPPPVEVRPVAIPAGLALIRANESGGDYTAYNPTGCGGYGCGGAYQLHLGYADDWAIRYGYPEWADTPPQSWPPAVQDAVAGGMYADDPGTWCRYTTYC